MGQFRKLQNEHDLMICFGSEAMKVIPFAIFQPFVSRLQTILNPQNSQATMGRLSINDPFLQKLVNQKYLKGRQLERKVCHADGKQFWTFGQFLHLLLSCFHLSKISKGKNGSSDNNVTWKRNEKNEVEITTFQSEFSSKASYSFIQLLVRSGGWPGGWSLNSRIMLSQPS